MSGTLYVVGTPIGNLEDLSLRAARVLREADVDRRRGHARGARRCSRTPTRSGRVNPARRVVSYFEGNEAERAAELVDALARGQRVAVISEAGMPGISDPGARAVAAAIDGRRARRGRSPGPTAALAALVGSGLPTDRFMFLGFPPREAGARRELFGTLRDEVATMIFYEAPDRVGATLARSRGRARRRPPREPRPRADQAARGARARHARASSRRATPTTPPRGECTLVVEGGAPAARAAIDIEAELRRLLAEGLGPQGRRGAARRRHRQAAPRSSTSSRCRCSGREP